MSDSAYSIDNPISRQEFVVKGHFFPFDKTELAGSVPERFERVVNEFPERTAIKTVDCTINYETLDRISNRVAQGILAHLGPDEEPVARYQHEEEEHRRLHARLREFRDLPAETADGVRVQLLANIGCRVE